MDLVFDDVSITYSTSGARGDVQAVKNISLTVPSGGTLGIAGESGSGKSTLMMTPLRLSPANARITGRVLVGEKDVAELSFGQVRALRWDTASIIFQGALHSLNPVRTVEHQIMEALDHHVSAEWKTEAQRKARTHELLAAVDLEPEHARAYPHELSGGQKQRVMIAMALACEPDIIIADEPTTALDVIVQAQVLDLLVKRVKDNGISLVMISHDLSVLAQVCERIAVMKDGEVVEVGQSYQICTAGTHPYTRKLAAAFPVIGDPESRMNPTRSVPHAAPHREPGEVLLDARAVNVTFSARGREVHAVRDVDLTVREGEILALVGQSGSGKTTLARTVLGIQEADPGSAVTFAGKPIPTRGRELKAFRRNMQMILQDPSGSLNPRVSVYEAVAEGARIHGLRGEHDKVTEALEKSELRPAAQFFESIPQELSGGQRQRVVIAGALVLGPQMLVADEPVASLDASVRGEILGLFMDLKNELGLSALIITHDLGVAWNIADTVAVMNNGAIVEHGPVEEVLLNPQHAYTRQLIAAAPQIAKPEDATHV